MYAQSTQPPSAARALSTRECWLPARGEESPARARNEGISMDQAAGGGSVMVLR